MLAIIAFVAFIIAAVLNLVKIDPKIVLWLIIIGGILISAAVAWGWAGPRYWNRGPAA
jgi:hypothetical protein